MHVSCGNNEQGCYYVVYIELFLSYGGGTNVSCKCFHLLKFLKAETCAILFKHIFPWDLNVILA